MILIKEIQFIKADGGKYLLLNLINGAADLISPQIYRQLSENRLADLEAAVVETMKKRRYLFENESEYQDFLQKLDAKLEGLEKSSVPSFLIIPSYSCNLKCTYCYERAYDIQHSPFQGRKDSIDRQFEVIAKIIGEIPPGGKTAFGNKDVKITIMGGEPLLPGNRMLIGYILNKIAAEGYRANIVTNGVDISAFIPELNKEVVEHIQITLDGPRKIHDRRRIFGNGAGSFDLILANIEKALEMGIKIYLRVNVDKENIDSLPELAGLITGHFKSAPNLHPYLYLMQDGGCSGEQNVLEESVGIETIFALEKKFPQMAVFQKKYHPAGFIEAIFSNQPFQPSLRHCGAARNQYILDYKGNIYKCWHGVGNPDFSVGQFEPGLEFNEKKDQWLNRSITSLEKCSACKYRYICGTGCPAARHGGSAMSDLDRPNCVDYGKLIDILVREHLKQG